jgi:microsomal dipeptidase-like Zn-dependent dipeptidase
VPALSAPGEAAVRTMRETGVLVDVSHMRDDAVLKTFALVESLDGHRDPSSYPIIASHAGYRFGGQHYNLTDATIAKLAARGGVVGLIPAQHQIKDGLRRTDTTTLSQSLDLLDRHIQAIGPAYVAIGTHLDGFIKPTLGGVEDAADLRGFAEALRARHGQSADAILRENALQIVKQRFSNAAP